MSRSGALVFLVLPSVVARRTRNARHPTSDRSPPATSPTTGYRGEPTQAGCRGPCREAEVRDPCSTPHPVPSNPRQPNSTNSAGNLEPGRPRSREPDRLGGIERGHHLYRSRSAFATASTSRSNHRADSSTPILLPQNSNHTQKITRPTHRLPIDCCEIQIKSTEKRNLVPNHSMTRRFNIWRSVRLGPSFVSELDRLPGQTTPRHSSKPKATIRRVRRTRPRPRTCPATTYCSSETVSRETAELRE